MNKLIIILGSVISVGVITYLGNSHFNKNSVNNQYIANTSTKTIQLPTIKNKVTHTVKKHNIQTVSAVLPARIIKKAVTTKKNTQINTEMTQKYAAAKKSIANIVSDINESYQPRSTEVITQVAKHAVTSVKPSTKTPSSAHTQAAFSVAGVNQHALKLGLNAYHKLQKEGKTHSNYLTLVDFTKPSTDPNRLTVIDVTKHKVVMHGLVAHGKGSGGKYATTFSNKSGTDASSLGVYLTGAPYVGKHGLSMHVRGLEKGLNDHAYARAIELHPAAYVSESFIKRTGRLGRSWGCFAVNPAFSKHLINTIKNGSVLFAYADQENHDPFVNMA